MTMTGMGAAAAIGEAAAVWVDITTKVV